MKKITFITGNQGSGKTKLAREMASNLGGFAEVTLSDLKNYVGEEFQTLIIDFESVKKSNESSLKVLCFNGSIILRKPYTKNVESYAIPNLIITGSNIPEDFIISVINSNYHTEIIKL